MTRTRFIALAVLIVAAVLVAWFTFSRRGDGGETRKLPDGSTLHLVEVVFTATNYTFVQQRGNKFTRLLAPIMPQSLRNRFSGGTGSVGWGGLEATNLMAATVNRSQAKDWEPGVERLQLFDEKGNEYDVSWGAPSAAHPGEKVQGWRAYAFPRRVRVLGLRFMMAAPDGHWTNVAEFRIRNPLYAKYPQWRREAWPNTKHDGTLAVTLKEFQSWADSGSTNLAETARTRLVLSFAEEGKDSHNWRIQKLTISDATGNRWSPYLNFTDRNVWNWATNGVAEFFGALWPGEEAWKLRVEVLRTAGFAPEQLWEVSVPLPPPRIANTLTNNWLHDGMTVTLVSVASPQTDHPGDFQSVGQWWGEDKKKVYSLALRIDPKPGGNRLSFVRCADERGREAKMLNHGSPDSDKQAVFFKPEDGANEARLTFAVQRSRFVEFLGRPEFVNAHLTRERGDSTKTSP
jgi:hypothetical protein